MAVTVWTSAYSKAHVEQTSDGGAVSVAIALSDNVSVFFKRSTDGITWPSSPVYVGALGSTNRQVHIREKLRAGRPTGELITTNGFDKMWLSRDMGRTWTAL